MGLGSCTSPRKTFVTVGKRRMLNEVHDKSTDKLLRVFAVIQPWRQEATLQSPQSSAAIRKVVFSQRKVIKNQTTKLSAAKKQTVAIRK